MPGLWSRIRNFLIDPPSDGKSLAVFRRMREAISKTDHGRRYGWWVLHEGKRIAELSYVYWDGDAQFWHYYHLGWLDEEIAMKLPPEIWPDNQVNVQNKEFQDVILPAFTSMRRGYEDTVGLRAVSVLEEEFRKRSEWSIPPLSSYELGWRRE